MLLNIAVSGGKKGMTSGGWGVDWKSGCFWIADSGKTTNQKGGFWGIVGARIGEGVSSRSIKEKKEEKRRRSRRNERVKCSDGLGVKMAAETQVRILVRAILFLFTMARKKTNNFFSAKKPCH